MKIQNPKYARGHSKYGTKISIQEALQGLASQTGLTDTLKDIMAQAGHYITLLERDVENLRERVSRQSRDLDACEEKIEKKEHFIPKAILGDLVITKLTAAGLEMDGHEDAIMGAVKYIEHLEDELQKTKSEAQIRKLDAIRLENQWAVCRKHGRKLEDELKIANAKAISFARDAEGHFDDLESIRKDADNQCCIAKHRESVLELRELKIEELEKEVVNQCNIVELREQEIEELETRIRYLQTRWIEESQKQKNKIDRLINETDNQSNIVELRERKIEELQTKLNQTKRIKKKTELSASKFLKIKELLG